MIINMVTDDWCLLFQSVLFDVVLIRNVTTILVHNCVTVYLILCTI